MTDVMIDLETLGTDLNSVVLSIGAVRFDLGQPAAEQRPFCAHISLDDSLKSGFEVSASTILWWMRQDGAARADLIAKQGEALEIHDALSRLSDFIPLGSRVWGNGADFDIALLTHMYRCVGMELPWNYYNVRCYRTMKSLFPQVPKPPKTGIAHTALFDAEFQVNHLQAIWSYVNGNKT